MTGFTGSAGFIHTHTHMHTHTHYDMYIHIYFDVIYMCMHVCRSCLGNNERGVALDGWSLPPTGFTTTRP